MMAFLFTPLGRYAALAVALFIAGWAVIAVIRRDAAHDALQAVSNANRANEGKADVSGHNAMTCPPELWSREKQICATKLH